MSKSRCVVWSLCMAVLLTAAEASRAQVYPNKPVRLVTGGVGGGADFVARLLAQGLNASYKSDALLNADLLGGQVQLTFGSASSVMPHAKAGKLRALAVTSVQPSALLPGLPPVAATVPGYQIGSVYGLLAPANTPASIIKHLHQETVRFLGNSDTRERLLNAGVEAGGGTPAEFTALIKSEMARIGKIIKEAGRHTHRVKATQTGHAWLHLVRTILDYAD